MRATNIKRLTFLSLLFLTIQLCSAQFFKTTLKTSLLSPPEKDIGYVQKIAILDFENVSSDAYKMAGADIGSKMADYLSAALLKEYRGKTGHSFMNGGRTDIYAILEREELKKILAEQEFDSGMISDTQAIELGSKLGVDAIIIGNVSYSSKDERSEDSYVDKKTKKLIRTYTLRRTCSAEARMKILSVKTGEVLGQTNSRGSSFDKTHSTNTRPDLNSVMSPNKIAEFACENMSYSLANYFAPYYYTHTFTFKNVKHKKLKERVKDARRFLKLKEIDKAYQMYAAIYQVDPYNPQLIYNMGVLNEIAGNYIKARELYLEVVNMDPENKAYVNGLKRAEGNMDLAHILSEMGIVIIPHKLLEASDIEKILVERIKIKGSRSKRKIAYETSSENSKEVGEFPGGLELDLIEKIEGGKWILAALPDGKKVYFRRKDVITGK
ncbi:CsgG/HfaB family protein [Aquimarina sp. 2201CG5-10]|uniref:CsgG/HfaB family protein n=1 Tax=Aquimarina callyspongiae TaxID=3098150 RepID=UPI002AB5C761|nr:CsgG/HfaB family protein [Aquimarina sp. 2201CG5-10]MDY8134854.1 CsgG/HfaB family protein [Aquimarina sp. 2201CG5-10]